MIIPGLFIVRALQVVCRSETLTNNGLIIPGLLIVRASQVGCRSETLTNNGLIIPGLFIVRASLRRVAEVKPSQITV